LIAPLLYLVQLGVAERIADFVQSGGTLVTGFLSGIANQSDLVFPGGPPGPLREMLGLWVEEIDALPPEEHNSIAMQHKLEALQGPYECNLLFAIPRLEGATVIATYGSDFYADSPVLTRNPYGQGHAWFVASSPDATFLRDFTRHLSISLGIKSVLPNLPSEIEATRRSKDGRHYLFLLNHSIHEQQVQLETGIQDLLTGQTHTDSVIMPARGVMIGAEI
jgi:beta-galactosidase